MPDSLTRPVPTGKTLVINLTFLPVHSQVHNINSGGDNGLVSRAISFLVLQNISLMHKSWIGPIWPLLEIFGDDTADDSEVIGGFIEPIIKDGLTKRVSREKAGVKVDQEAEEYSLLSSLLTQTDNYKVLRDETFNVLLAGKFSLSEYSSYWIADICRIIARNPVGPSCYPIPHLSYMIFQVASLLTSVFYCFSQYPQVMIKLRQEIINRIGPSRPPTSYDLGEMKYLRAVIDGETITPFNEE